MLVKIHNSYRTTVAVCDSELIGKKFEEGLSALDVRESFFKGEEKTEKEVEDIMTEYSAEDAIFNIVGKESVNLALKLRIVIPEGIRYIQGVPVALVLL